MEDRAAAVQPGGDGGLDQRGERGAESGDVLEMKKGGLSQMVNMLLQIPPGVSFYCRLVVMDDGGRTLPDIGHALTWWGGGVPDKCDFGFGAVQLKFRFTRAIISTRQVVGMGSLVQQW